MPIKLPVPVPPWPRLFQRHAGQTPTILSHGIRGEVRGVYEHWDHLRHLTPPQGLDVEQWWLGIKLARQSRYKALQLRDKFGKPFHVCPSDSACVRGAAGSGRQAALETHTLPSWPEKAARSRDW